MRISNTDIENIKKIVLGQDPNSKIYLFGSRTKDNLKGGDIDLMIISDVITFDIRRKIKLKLYDALGEQKIDVVLADSKSIDPFVTIVKKKGILL